MSRLTIEEAKQIREVSRKKKQLENLINDYRLIESELGINLTSQIEEMEEELYEIR